MAPTVFEPPPHGFIHCMPDHTYRLPNWDDATQMRDMHHPSQPVPVISTDDGSWPFENPILSPSGAVMSHASSLHGPSMVEELAKTSDWLLSRNLKNHALRLMKSFPTDAESHMQPFVAPGFPVLTVPTKSSGNPQIVSRVPSQPPTLTLPGGQALQAWQLRSAYSVHAPVSYVPAPHLLHLLHTRF